MLFIEKTIATTSNYLTSPLLPSAPPLTPIPARRPYTSFFHATTTSFFHATTTSFFHATTTSNPKSTEMPKSPFYQAGISLGAMKEKKR
jgi:hypothetical protein